MKTPWLSIFGAILSITAVHAQSADLMTKTENTLGVSLTHYKYDEPSYMSLTAALAGFELSRTQSLGTQWPNTNQGWFVRGDLRYALGKADYQSAQSGTLNDTPNWYLEARALVGKDFDLGNSVLAPYVGLGFRYLHNDLRTSDARQGYRRDSSYLALPIGLTHKMQLSNASQLLTTLEYLHLIKGVQQASLSDENPNRQNVRLDQPKGYGLRLGAMMRFDDWSVGPTLSYWNVAQSEVGGVPPVYEPKNTSYELGLKLMKHF